jgi:hypothetical protein
MCGMTAFSDPPLIERRKLREYLLALNHRTGRSKALYLASLGYTQRNWMRLRNDLLIALRNASTAHGVPGPYGVRFTIPLEFEGPTGRPVRVTTVWIAEDAAPRPRLVTLFPRRPR